ncbi:hypothetical protein HMPREF1326_01548 [Akkermansia sp. KLE1605]|nr:hypothetical protein HMPREF1326_01548 [Akkermansia sp. KLE1605]
MGGHSPYIRHERNSVKKQEREKSCGKEFSFLNVSVDRTDIFCMIQKAILL